MRMAAVLALSTLASSCRSSSESGHKPRTLPSAPAAAPSGSSVHTGARPEASHAQSSRLGLRGTCPGESVAQCVRKYAKDKLSPSDVDRLRKQGISECFTVSDRRRLWDEGACLPLDVGVDQRNGRIVQLQYHCSDVCPDQGGVGVFYASVAKDDCCAVGGHPHFDPAWGVYRGCLPPEVPLTPFNHPRPDGRMDQATRSPCDPTKIVFADGTVVTDLRGTGR